MLRGGFVTRLARSTPSILQSSAVSAASSPSASAASRRSVSHLSWPSSSVAGRGRGHSWLLRSQGAREVSSIAGKWGGLGPNDPCLILGVNRNAGLEEIKKAYREKARKMHPDLHPNKPDAKDKFAQLNASHEALTSDWETREEWDDFAKKHKFRARPVPKLISESLARAVEARKASAAKLEDAE